LWHSWNDPPLVAAVASADFEAVGVAVPVAVKLKGMGLRVVSTPLMVVRLGV
jgi:hypothetical protein